MAQVDEATVARCYRQAGAERWGVSRGVFAAALERSVAKTPTGRALGRGEIGRLVSGLHLEDLALACACAAGHDGAWEHFIREQRPVLYRAADAIDPTGGAREVADALYGELYGLREQGGARKSLFDYFHGRSSLATWLRAILAQRHVDHVRAHRRLDRLPDDEAEMPAVSNDPPPDPDRGRFLALIHQTLAAAIAGLAPRDRLRLGCYYGQDMTLAQIGELLREHEATVSRHLTRTRRAIRDEMERRLRDEHGLDEAGIRECFAAATTDAGALDLSDWLEPQSERKVGPAHRSTGEDTP